LEEAKQIVFQLKKIPGMVQDLLDAKEEIRKLARKFYRSRNLFFIGRNLNYPIALEGALKMKEIAYIPCEGYPSGELKHGPLALLGKDVPVVAIVGPGETYEKILGNIKEIKARDASVIAIAEENDREIEKFADFILKVPSCGELLFPLLATVAVQLFAYYVAYFRKCSIDKPRNLAKSVTVE
jgi:glucosamine--fructose-6-phosphate aminotransferase (isomerizing)